MDKNEVSIHPSAIIYENVIIGSGTVIGPFCIVGEPPRGKSGGELATEIGANSVIRSHSVIYAGNRIGSRFSTGHHTTIREENSIGDNVSIGTFSCIEHHLVIEDGVRIHSNVFIPEFCVIKKEAWIGPNAVFTNARYPRSSNVKETLRGAYVEEQAKIGANVTVLPGLRIGRNSLIGSGAVVTKDVVENGVYAGTPAKKIRDISEIEEYM